MAIDCGNDDIDTIYDYFIKIIKWHINCTVPTRNVTMRERNPSYITPCIKLLLHKRNKLRSAGKVEHADNHAVKINRCIARTRSSAYSNCSSELVEVVTRIVNMSVSCGVLPAAWRTAVIHTFLSVHLLMV